MLASVTGPLAAATKTPIGPVATAIGDAISRTVRNFDASGGIRLVNFPGGGAARIESADVIGAEWRAGPRLGRRRRDLLLADGAHPHRRRISRRPAAACRPGASRFTSRATARR